MTEITAQNIEDWVETSMHYGMTGEQIKNFVINSHVTDFRQLRQALIEIESRNHERKKVKLDRKRKTVKIRQLEEKLEKEDDPFERELIELDIAEYKLDLGKFDVSIRQYDHELEPFMNYVRKHYKSIEEMGEAADYTEEEERKYWIARMGKQAAIDIYANGRIGIGNMDSIAMMREEDLIYAVSIAMQYSGKLNAGIAKVQNSMKPYIDKMLTDGEPPRFPTFDNIEENLNLELFNQLTAEHSNEQKSLQSTDKSEAE